MRREVVRGAGEEQRATASGAWPGGWRGVALAAWLVGVLAVTLTPAASTTPVPVLCFPCGESGVADALLNVVLFVPLGWLLAPRWPAGRVVAAAAALSLGVETAQLALPGRYPTVADLVVNTAGAGLGVLAWRWPRAAAGAAALGALALLLAPPLLLRPSVPGGWLAGQYAHSFGGMGTYGGRILDASVGGRPIAWGRVSEPGAVAGALSAGETLEMRFVAGPAPDTLSPLLSLMDEGLRFVYLVGAEGDDLVVDPRTRAEALGLRAAPLRFPGLLRGLEGDTLRLRVAREGRVWTAELAGRVARARTPSVAGGWTLLMPLDLPPALRRAVDAAWVALLAAVVVGAGLLLLLRRRRPGRSPRLSRMRRQ